jgi:hypothetical protein
VRNAPKCNTENNGFHGATMNRAAAARKHDIKENKLIEEVLLK